MRRAVKGISAKAMALYEFMQEIADENNIADLDKPRQYDFCREVGLSLSSVRRLIAELKKYCLVEMTETRSKYKVREKNYARSGNKRCRELDA